MNDIEARKFALEFAIAREARFCWAFSLAKIVEGYLVNGKMPEFDADGRIKLEDLRK